MCESSANREGKKEENTTILELHDSGAGVIFTKMTANTFVVHWGSEEREIGDQANVAMSELITAFEVAGVI
jgi:hypothetical protein